MLWPSLHSCSQPASAGALTSRSPLMLIPEKDPDLSSRLRLAACSVAPYLPYMRPEYFGFCWKLNNSDAYQPGIIWALLSKITGMTWACRRVCFSLLPCSRIIVIHESSRGRVVVLESCRSGTRSTNSDTAAIFQYRNLASITPTCVRSFTKGTRYLPSL